jgi:hypothetical protein
MPNGQFLTLPYFRSEMSGFAIQSKESGCSLKRRTSTSRRTPKPLRLPVAASATATGTPVARKHWNSYPLFVHFSSVVAERPAVHQPIFSDSQMG